MLQKENTYSLSPGEELRLDIEHDRSGADADAVEWELSVNGDIECSVQEESIHLEVTPTSAAPEALQERLDIFVDECLVEADDAAVRYQRVYEAFVDWLGEPSISKVSFGLAHDFEVKRRVTDSGIETIIVGYRFRGAGP